MKIFTPNISDKDRGLIRMKYKPGTFSITPNKELMRGKPTELQAVHFWLCDRADENGYCYPSRPKIAEDSGIKSLRTVDKYIKILIEMDILKKKIRKDNDKTNLSNLYQIMIPEMHDIEQEVPEYSASDDTGGSAKDSTVTIPIENYTHLTISSEGTSETGLDTVDPLVCLPEAFGKTPIIRLMKVYNALWLVKFNSPRVSDDYPRLGKAFKKLLETFTEIQIAILMDTYFDWMGVTGDNQKDNDFLAGNGFSVELLAKRVDILIAYVKNVLGGSWGSVEGDRAFARKILKAKKII